MHRIVCLMVMVFGCLPQPLQADVIFLVNGDRLTGKITKMLDQQLSFTSDLAGDVTINMSAIQSFATDAPIVLHLQDGSVIKHRISASDAGAIEIEPGAILVKQVVQLADIAKINPPGPKWNVNVSAGFALNRGNTESESANVAADLNRRTAKDRITFAGLYLFSREKNKDTGDSNTSENEWFAQFQYDYFIKPKLYAYAKSRVEQNRVADLDLRLFAGLGAGYQWVESPTFNVATQAGVGWRFEAFEDGENNSEPAAEFTYHIDKAIGSRFSLFHDLSLLPSLTDLSDVVLRTQAGARLSLSKLLFTESRFILAYDSMPAEDTESTDFKWLLSVGMNF